MLLCCLIVLALATLISAQRNNRFNNRQNRQNNGNRGNNRNVGNRNRQNAGRNNRQNNRNQTPNRNPVINGGRFRATPANARDRLGNEVYPGCNGTVCLPEARLCANRKQKRELLLYFLKIPLLKPQHQCFSLKRNYCFIMITLISTTNSMPIVVPLQKYCQFLHYSIHFPCYKACQMNVQQHKIKALDTDAVFSTKLNIDYLLKRAEKRRSYVIIV